MPNLYSNVNMLLDDHFFEIGWHSFPIGLHLYDSNSGLVAVDASQIGWQNKIVENMKN